jgi:adenine-specific DNA-methyltransferase
MKKVDLLEGQSLSLVNDNIQHLKEIFPEAFTENGLDFAVLRQLLGDAKVLIEGEEKYGLNWHGKKKARQIALTPSLGTLLPCVQESVDWDKTQNLFIEGDNLEVLKLLQKSYANKVKMIYIDPPYNTGGEFVYPDNYQDNLDTYLRYTGQKGDDGLKFSSNTESSGRKHTNWLNMMYSRLKLAKSLLAKNGVIFINIGEEELTNLEKLSNEIFGEENKVSIITRISKTASNLGSHFASSTDFLLCYAKDIQFLPPFSEGVNESLYKKIETEGVRKGERYRDDVAFYQSSQKDIRPNQKYFIKCPDGEEVVPPCSIQDDIMREGDGRWRWSKETYLKNQDFLVFKKTNTSPLMNRNGEKAKWNIYTKSYLLDRQEKGVLPRNFFDQFINRKGADLLKKYEIPFDFSKPVELIEFLISIMPFEDGSIVLDFFAGSATTAHSVMNQNIANNYNLRFLMVQLPELCDEKSEAYKAGYKTIADIGKERIRRAAKKIKEEYPDYNGDLGFKVFKLSSSNIKAWNPDASNIETSLLNQKESLVEGRGEQDLVYELLLKRGIDLSTPIKMHQIKRTNQVLYIIGEGAVFACLGNSLGKHEIEAVAYTIINLAKELKPEMSPHIFFRDSAFTDDIAKTNMVAILEQNGFNHVRSL